MNIIDGKKIAFAVAEEVKMLVAAAPTRPRLTVFACAPNFETRKYLSLKQNKALALGIDFKLIDLPETISTADFILSVTDCLALTDGVIVQLPIPSHLDTEAILQSIPATHDVDAFSYQGGETVVLPPVIGAIDLISKHEGLNWEGKQVVIFGQGRLVGAPAISYARSVGAIVTILTETSSNVLDSTRQADIIILGVGQPNLLTAEMVKPGVAVFDAGASEDGGLLVGDASKAVANVASLFTPVPGGIGPITISLLFRNLLKLQSRQ